MTRIIEEPEKVSLTKKSIRGKRGGGIVDPVEGMREGDSTFHQGAGASKSVMGEGVVNAGDLRRGSLLTDGRRRTCGEGTRSNSIRKATREKRGKFSFGVPTSGGD